MYPAPYYRQKAAHARKLADMSPEGEVRRALEGIIVDYEQIAEDLELGAIEIRHPELMPQKNE
jgi:hypothetical protein